VEEHSLHHVGSGRAAEPSSCLEHLLLQYGVCDSGDRLNGQRATVGDKAGAVSHVESRGAEQGRGAGVCQQAGCEGRHVRGGDQQTAGPHRHQETPVAHPVLLRSLWRGALPRFGVDMQPVKKEVTLTSVWLISDLK